MTDESACEKGVSCADAFAPRWLSISAPTDCMTQNGAATGVASSKPRTHSFNTSAARPA